METPLGKVSAAPPIANLVHGTVTCRVKRRKSGGRVIRQLSPEIMPNGVATLFTERKPTRVCPLMVRIYTALRGWKSAMPYNDAASTGESLWLPYQAGVEPIMYKWYARQLTEEGKRATGSRMAA